MFLRRLRIIGSPPFRLVVAMGMLIWAWGCTDERRDPLLAPPSGEPLMAVAVGPGLISVEFDGTVTAVTDPGGYLQGNVGAGDAVTGLFVYDETAPDEHAKPDVGRYRFSEPSCTVVVYAGLLVFASDPASTNITIKLTNDKKTNVLKDQFEVQSASNLDVLPAVGVSGINILLVDETATALSSDALAGQRPDAVEWLPTRTLVVNGVDGWTVETEINLIIPSSSTTKRKEAKTDFHRH